MEYTPRYKLAQAVNESATPTDKLIAIAGLSKEDWTAVLQGKKSLRIRNALIFELLLPSFDAEQYLMAQLRSNIDKEKEAVLRFVNLIKTQADEQKENI